MIDKIDTQDIKRYNYKETAISDGAITGVCEFGTIEMELFNDNNKYSNLENKWVSSKFGDIYIYKVEPDQATMNIRIECYDSRYKLDKEYDKTLYSFPMTLREYRNKVFENSGLSYKNDDSFPNENEVLNSQPYIGDNPTNRDALKVISQAALSIIAKTEEDIYYFKWFDDNDIFEVEDSLALTTDSEYTEPINLIILGRGNTEDNVYYPSNPPSEKHEFRIDNNYILDPQDSSTNEDKRYDVIKPLYNRINGLKYIIYNMRTTFIENKLDIKLGSKIKFFDREGKLLESFVMSKEINYLGGDYNNPDNYEVTLSAEAINETNTEISYASSIKNDILRVERKADKNEGIIQDTISKIENIELETTTSKNAEGYPIEIEDAGPYNIEKGIIYGRSEQEIIEASKNLLPVNKPSYTINGIEVTNDNDGTYTLNGTATDNTYIDLYEGPELTLQPGTYTGSLEANRVSYIRYNTDKTYYQLSRSSGASNTFTLTEVYTFNRIYVYAQTGNTFNNEIIKPMLQKGTTKEEFEPYCAGMPSPSNKSEIKSIQGITNCFDGLIENGGYSSQTGTKINASTLTRNVNPILVDPNEEYIFSNNDIGIPINVLEYKEDNSFIKVTTVAVNTSFVTSSETKYINFYRGNNFTDKIQLEKGTIIHSYVDYGRWLRLIAKNKNNDTKSALIDMNEYDENNNIVGYHEFCSSKDLSITDEYEITTGLLTKKINKVVLNGTEEGWATGTDGFNSYYIKFKDEPLINSNLVNIMCDYFKGVKHADRVISENNIVYFTSDGLTYFRNTDFATLAEFKTWLSNNPITIEYVLAKPKQIQLKSTNLQLFEGYNLITIDSDLEPTNMFIEYLTNSKLNGQYATKSELKIAENEISSRLSKKVSTDDFETTIEEVNNNIEQKISDSESSINLELNKKVKDSDFTAAKIVLKINNGPSSAIIDADKVDIDAIATFTNNKLKDAGSTVINGSNITTGTISANRINGGAITGSSINLGSGKFKADINGRVDCSDIHATGGTLGGWEITTDSIRSLKKQGYQVAFSDASNQNGDVLSIYL